jgi:hypothetical protein
MMRAKMVCFGRERASRAARLRIVCRRESVPPAEHLDRVVERLARTMQEQLWEVVEDHEHSACRRDRCQLV